MVIIGLTKIEPYRRIYRICPKMYKELIKKVPKSMIGNIADPPKRKKCLEEDAVKELFKGHIDIDEKIDGGVLGLAWDGNSPIIVGKHNMVDYNHSSKKFYGLREWVLTNWRKISQIPLGWIVYGEWMRARHNIPYDSLPDFFIGFDVWNGTNFLNCTDRSEFLYNIGFAEVQLVHSGTNYGIEDIICILEGNCGVNNKSRYNKNELVEGLVVRNDNGLIGKYVRREFMESIEENWLTLPLVENKLASRRNYG